MWEARAEYKDGTVIEKYFEENENITEAEDQYRIENWLLNAHDECVWYSVNWVYE